MHSGSDRIFCIRGTVVTVRDGVHGILPLFLYKELSLLEVTVQQNKDIRNYSS